MPAGERSAAVRAGAYASHQLSGRGLIAWSHARRFSEARRLVEPLAGAPLLDYGCGDGTFLSRVSDLFPGGVGAELDPALVRDATSRLGGGGQRFVHVEALAALPDASFGVVTCMEVLEHCTADTVDGVLATLRRLLAPGGTLLVSVPVETGPSLLVKQAARALAGRRGVPGYAQRERYRAGELLRMLVAGAETRIPRPVYETRFEDGTPNRYHGHKGFNWRVLASRLDRELTVREVRFSPVHLPGGLLASQVWIRCQRP
jgi:2-polyprenyl-3-methyl-5-hydroxy-6-metoxy-1,4-benzoquinol methylase